MSDCSPQGHPELSVPHVSVPDIRWVDWRALRAAGFKGCVFDKDNTLTEPYALGIHEPLAASMQHCMETFEGNIAVLSNSAGLQEFDPKGVSPQSYNSFYRALTSQRLINAASHSRL